MDLIDLHTVSLVTTGLSLAGSAVLFSMSAARLKIAGRVLNDANERLAKQIASDKSETIADLHEVCDAYYNQLISDQSEIRHKNFLIELFANEAEDLDGVLRRIYPDLPSLEVGYDPAEVVETLFESALTAGFVETFGADESGLGVVSRVTERLVAEIEARSERINLLEGELQDTYMKHGHAVDVIRAQSGLIDEQAEVISELREEKATAEHELLAIKTVANDDSADADRYAADLAKADALVSTLNYELQRSGYRYAISTAQVEDLAEVCIRNAARTNVGRGEGAEIKRAA